MSFVLVKDGEEIARHSTRIACAVEAIEHKLAYQSRRLIAFGHGVHIREDRSREGQKAPRNQEGSA